MNNWILKYKNVNLSTSWGKKARNWHDRSFGLLFWKPSSRPTSCALIPFLWIPMKQTLACCTHAQLVILAQHDQLISSSLYWADSTSTTGCAPRLIQTHAVYPCLHVSIATVIVTDDQKLIAHCWHNGPSPILLLKFHFKVDWKNSTILYLPLLPANNASLNSHCMASVHPEWFGELGSRRY